MNVIKYLHPGTGETRRVTARQPKYSQVIYSYRFGGGRRGTVAEVDEEMAKHGFVRCGIRRGKAKNVRTARRLEAKEKARANG